MGRVVDEILPSVRGRAMPTEDKNNFVMKAISEMEEEVARVPRNARIRLFLGTMYTRFNAIDEKTYLQKGEEHLREALRLSPNKMQIYFALAENYLQQNDGEKAYRVTEE